MAGKSRTWAGRAFDRIVSSLAGLAAVLIVAMMGIVSLEVLMRYFFHKPQLWVVEVGEYMMVWVTFLGAALILQEDGHVKVEILFQQFPPKIRALCGIFGSLLCASLCLLLLLFGAMVVWNLFETWESDPKSQIGFPKGPLLSVIPIACFLLMVQFLRRFKSFLNDWRDGQA